MKKILPFSILIFLLSSCTLFFPLPTDGIESFYEASKGMKESMEASLELGERNHKEAISVALTNQATSNARNKNAISTFGSSKIQEELTKISSVSTASKEFLEELSANLSKISDDDTSQKESLFSSNVLIKRKNEKEWIIDDNANNLQFLIEEYNSGKFNCYDINLLRPFGKYFSEESIQIRLKVFETITAYANLLKTLSSSKYADDVEIAMGEVNAALTNLAKKESLQGLNITDSQIAILSTALTYITKLVIKGKQINALKKIVPEADYYIQIICRTLIEDISGNLQFSVYIKNYWKDGNPDIKKIIEILKENLKEKSEINLSSIQDLEKSKEIILKSEGKLLFREKVRFEEVKGLNQKQISEKLRDLFEKEAQSLSANLNIVSVPEDEKWIIEDILNKEIFFLHYQQNSNKKDGILEVHYRNDRWILQLKEKTFFIDNDGYYIYFYEKNAIQGIRRKVYNDLKTIQDYFRLQYNLEKQKLEQLIQDKKSPQEIQDKKSPQEIELQKANIQKMSLKYDEVQQRMELADLFLVSLEKAIRKMGMAHSSLVTLLNDSNDLGFYELVGEIKTEVETIQKTYKRFKKGKEEESKEKS